MKADGPELRDIHLPADPSWWPPAPGWWVLLVILLVLVWVAVTLLRRRQRRRRWQARVMSELDAIAAHQQRAPDAVQLAAELSQLLRRASRLLDSTAPALHGDAWLSFLDKPLGGTDFTDGIGRVLLEGPYRRDLNMDADALLELAHRWLKRAIAERRDHV
jgi:hypothetical protein